MAPRDLIALRLDRETPETIRSALDALDGLKTSNPRHLADIREMRSDFTAELKMLLESEAQGALF